MNKKQLKKLIAREGLIFLIYILFLAVILISEMVFGGYYQAVYFYVFINIFYVVYWVVRFILWAIRTVKTKE